MKILSIDTSSEICSVAILENMKVLKELHTTNEKEHSETLMPMIEELFNSLNLKIEDIELLACTKGPGSFTGIRVGMATIKAFSDAKKIPVVGINSLEVLAYLGAIKKGDGEYISIIDAKNDNIYAAIYKVKNRQVTVYKSPETMHISKVTEYIDNLNLPTYFVGNIDISKIEPLYLAKVSMQKANGEDVLKHEYLQLDELEPLAIGAGIAAFNKYNSGIFGNSKDLVAMYLRKPQAQRQKEGTSDDVAILEMTYSDLENIKLNYERFPSSWEYEVLKEDYSDSRYFVIKQNEDICGFIGIRIVFEEMEIMNIVTDITKRNQGFASSLLSYIIKYAVKNNIEKINLEVNTNNKVAKNLYKSFGFVEVGKRPRYYKGEDAILMTNTL